MSGLFAIGSGLIGGPEAAAVTTAGDPYIGCDIAFTSVPDAEEPAWVDVAQDLRAFSFTRGKQRELDRYQAARGAVTLSNGNRRYDPTHTPGAPYEGNIKPQRRIRLTGTYNGTTHPLIEGFVDGWDQEGRGPNDAVANVTFTDGFKVLSKRTLPRSVYTREVQVDAPYRWWRLDEPSGSTTLFDSSGNKADGEAVGSPTLGATTLIDRDGGAAMTVAGSASTRQGFVIGADKVPSTIPAGTGDFSVEFWLQCGEQASTGYVFSQFTNDDALLTGFVDISVGAGANLGLIVFRVGVLPGRLTNLRVDDNVRHHVVCVKSSAGLRIYVDGVDRTDLTLGADTTGAVVSSDSAVGHYVTALAGFTGTLDEFAVYNYALSTTRISAHNSAGRTPWTGDTPAARLDRVLDAVRWPESRREIDTGTSVLQGADLGQTALAHAQKVGDSEFGQLYMSKAGVLRLVARTATTNRTPVATFTDDDDYQGTDPEYSDELLRNSATVSRAEGVAQTYEDDTSIDEFLIQSYTSDGMFHNSDLLSRHAAEYIVNVSKDPLLRIRQLTIMPRHNPQVLFPLLLAVELGDWVVVEQTPQDVGSTFTQTAVVEGIQVDWSPKSWTFTLSLSPFGTDEVLELDAPADHAGLDTARLFF